MAITIAFPALKQEPSPREVVSVVNNLMDGATNSKLEATLTANAATTTITDVRLGLESILLPNALTANAALIQGSLWYDNFAIGSVRVNHTNSATADKTFRFEIRK